MRVVFLALAGLALACGRSGYRERDLWVGASASGFGAAVAFWEGEARIGAPWGEAGEVWQGRDRLLVGEGRDFLGASFSPDGAWVGAPLRSPGGAVVDGAGGVVLAGEAGENLGSHPVRIDGLPAALRSRGWRGEADSFVAPGRLWTLIHIDGPERWAAGLATGGVVVGGRTVAGPGAWGRGLAACDLDARRGDEIAVGDPLSGQVSVHRAADLAAGLVAPLVTLELGPGAGAPLACAQGALVVGAPRRGEVVVVDDPLGGARSRILGGEGGRFGAAIAVDGDRLLVGDPEEGVVRLFQR